MPASTEDGLRAVLLGGVALGCGGAMAELALMEHWDSPVQLVPFALGGLGLGAAAWALAARSRWAVLALRAAMVALVLGGGLGVWEHLEHNYAFQVEIRPTASARERAMEAVFGASPALAPGVLAWIGLLGLGATWRHPAI